MEISAERLDGPKKKFWLVLSQLILELLLLDAHYTHCLHCMRGGHDFGNLLMDFLSPQKSPHNITKENLTYKHSEREKNSNRPKHLQTLKTKRCSLSQQNS